jgi:hypothetical protein
LRIGDALYFSPRFRFRDLLLDDPETLIDAFRDRVVGFYLDPASRALDASDVFAGGLTCCAAIDFLALACADSPPIDWLERHIPEFRGNKLVVKHFWIAFRHGLTHEGYIKSQGQFSLEIQELFVTTGPVLVINPRILLTAIRSALSEFCENFSQSQAAQLSRRLHRYFDAEIKASRKQ